MSLKDVILELSDIDITIFEHFLPHTAQLRVYVISPLEQSQLKLVLVSVGIGIVPAVRSSIEEAKPQSIDETVFLETDYNAIALFLCLNKGYFGEIVFHCFGMGRSDEKICLSEIEDPIEHTEIVLF